MYERLHCGVYYLRDGIEADDADKDYIYFILYLICTLLDKCEHYTGYAYQQGRHMEGDMRHIYAVHFRHRLSLVWIYIVIHYNYSTLRSLNQEKNCKQKMNGIILFAQERKSAGAIAPAKIKKKKE